MRGGADRGPSRSLPHEPWYPLRALPLPDDRGWIVDTPGIRSFGLAHVDPDRLIEAFPDLDEMTDDCPRGCTHGEDEPECGLDEAIAAGQVDPLRVESFRRLLAARDVDPWTIG